MRPAYWASHDQTLSELITAVRDLEDAFTSRVVQVENADELSQGAIPAS